MIRSTVSSIAAVVALGAVAACGGRGLSLDPTPGPPGGEMPGPGDPGPGGGAGSPPRRSDIPGGLGTPRPAGPPVPRQWEPCATLGGAGINTLAQDPGGKVVAIGYGSGVVRLHAAEDRRVLATLVAHNGPVQALALSRDGQMLASASELQVALWRTTRGEAASGPLAVWGPSRDVAKLAFSPDGTLLLGIHQSTASATVWEVASGAVVASFAQTTVAAFTADSRAVVIVEGGGPAVRWMSLDGQELRRLSLGERLTNPVLAPAATALAGFSNGTGGPRLLLVPLGEGVVNASGERVPAWRWTMRFAGFPELTLLLFTHDGRHLVQIDEERVELRTVDLADGSPAGVLVASATLSQRLRHPMLSPDGRSLVAATHDQTLVQLSLPDGVERPSFETLGGSPTPAHALDVSPDGRFVASSETHGPHAVWLWDLQTRKVVRSYPGAEGFTLGTRFSPESDLLAIFGDSAQIMRVGDGGFALRVAIDPQIDARTHTGHRIAFPPTARQGTTFRYALSDRRGVGTCHVDLTMLDPSGYHERRCSGGLISSEIRTASGLAYSPDGHALASAGIALWAPDLPGGPIWEFPSDRALPYEVGPDGPATSWAAFSPDNTYVLTSSCPDLRDGCDRPGGKVFRVADGTVVREFTGGRHAVFSADGRHVLAGDILTEIATGETRLLLAPTDVSAFLPDQGIVTADRSGVLRLLCPVP
jgi:WD40 repeat protein